MKRVINVLLDEVDKMEERIEMHRGHLEISRDREVTKALIRSSEDYLGELLDAVEIIRQGAK